MMTRIKCPRCMGHADVSFFTDPKPSINVPQQTIQHCAHARECGEAGGACPYLARAVATDPEILHHAALLRRAAKVPMPAPEVKSASPSSWWRW